jgi:CHAD domain-containing protein
VKELRSIGGVLGAVRDIDVLLENLESHIEKLPGPGRESVEPLRNAWRRDRQVARVRLVNRLDSKGYREFVDDYLDFTDSTGAAEVITPLGQPSLVRDTAGSRILAAYERVRAYDTIITWADVDTLHALRVESKRLRYTLEYFSEVLPVKARQLIAQITEMQDHLGLLSDADVSAKATREWLNVHAPQLPAQSREAVGIYLDSREAEVETMRRSFRPLWRRFTGRTFRKALGLAVTQIE